MQKKKQKSKATQIMKAKEWATCNRNHVKIKQVSTANLERLVKKKIYQMTQRLALCNYQENSPP